MLSVGIQSMLETILVELATLLLVGPRQLFEADGLLLEFFAELLVQRLVRHLVPLFLPDCREPRVLGAEQHVRHRRGRQLAAQEPRQLDDVRGFAFDLLRFALLRCASILFALLRLALRRFACSGLVWSAWVWSALMLWSACGVVWSDALVCLLWSGLSGPGLL